MNVYTWRVRTGATWEQPAREGILSVKAEDRHEARDLAIELIAPVIAPETRLAEQIRGIYPNIANERATLKWDPIS